MSDNGAEKINDIMFNNLNIASDAFKQINITDKYIDKEAI